MHPQIPELLLGITGQLTSVIEKVPILKEIAGSLIITMLEEMNNFDEPT
jgi:hypothetical protein